MKKKVVLFVFAFAFSCIACLPGLLCSRKSVANAATHSYNEIETWFGAEYQKMMFQDGAVRFLDRTAGTDGERAMAEYLEQRMIEMGYLPNGKAGGAHPSFEEFEFTSSIDGNLYRSQNVLFLKKGGDSSKKIVVCTSIDNAFGFASGVDASLEAIGSDAETNNILSVLSVAYQLSDRTLDFDVEIVFFGAGYHSYAGSEFFVLGLDETERANFLVALNFDDLSADDLYYYDKENGSAFGKYFGKFVVDNSDIDLNHYRAGNSVLTADVGTYPYSHRALFSDNSSLIFSGIRTVSFLSVSKSGFWGNEYFAKGESAAFDSRVYPNEYMTRAAQLSLVVSNAICADGFEAAMHGSAQVSSFWTNTILHICALLGGFVVIVFVYVFLYRKMFDDMKKHYSASAVKSEILTLVDKQIEESGNPELMAHKDEIEKLYDIDVSNKMENDDSGDERE